jgi:hypothetical protein
MTIPPWARGAMLLTATLGAGIVLGVVYERHHGSHAMPRHGIRIAAVMPASHVAHDLAPELGLDSTQQHAITAILARHQGTVDSSWHRVQPHVRATLDSTIREIMEQLRPDQAERFRRMVETMHPGIIR